MEEQPIPMEQLRRHLPDGETIDAMSFSERGGLWQILQMASHLEVGPSPRELAFLGELRVVLEPFMSDHPKMTEEIASMDVDDVLERSEEIASTLESEEAKLATLQSCACLLFSDSSRSAREVAFCMELAEHLGLSRQLAEQMLRSVLAGFELTDIHVPSRAPTERKRSSNRDIGGYGRSSPLS